MALPGPAWKHASSSGVSTRLGARPLRAGVGRHGARRVGGRSVGVGRCKPPLPSPLPFPRARRAGPRSCVRLWLGDPFAPSLPEWYSRQTRTASGGASVAARPVAVAPRPLGPLAQMARPKRVRASHVLPTRHRMRQDYPLNLSISLSGGEETNQDAPSNGE